MRTIRYVTAVPRKPLPPGHVVVHNHAPAAPKIGQDGFRAWIAAPADDGGYNVVRCDCGWAPDLPEHFRVRVRE
jgi:hypothetical protein